MATMHETQHEKFARTRPECCIVVNDVDDTEEAHEVDHGRMQHPAARDTPKTDTHLDNTPSRETTRAKIEQMQVEAESRKIEFARLLDEHAQVIRRLKQMEESESNVNKA